MDGSHSNYGAMDAAPGGYESASEQARRAVADQSRPGGAEAEA